MKSKLTYLFVFFITVLLSAQSFEKADEFFSPEIPGKSELTEENAVDIINKKFPSFFTTLTSTFAVKYAHDLTTASSGKTGFAGIGFDGTHYYVSLWQNDSVFVFDTSGAFVEKFAVSGMSGIRSLSWNGTNFYAGNATSTVYSVNMTTRTATPVLDISSTGVTARFVSYHPGWNAVYVGNFNTDIYLVSISTGNVLDSILATDLGFGGNYGLAYDNITEGGPYLWFSTQGGPGENSTDLVVYDINKDTVHGFYMDVGEYIITNYGITSSLAGGVTITSDLISGKNHLITCAQGSPRNYLVVYEMGQLPSTDIELTKSLFDIEYGITPSFLCDSIQPGGIVTNIGTDTLHNVKLYLDIHKNSAIYDSKISDPLPVLLPGESDTIRFDPDYLSAPGSYKFSLNASMDETDDNYENNSDYLDFYISDSVLARDNGDHIGGTGYAVSASDFGEAGHYFDVDDTVAVNSITMFIIKPALTFYYKGYLRNFGGGFPTDAIDSTYIHQFTTEDSAWITLDFLNAPVVLMPGRYYVGAYEGPGAVLGLGQCNSIFTEGTNFFFTAGSGWLQSGIPTARMIRLNLDSEIPVSIHEYSDRPSSFSLSQNYPNPFNPSTRIEFALPIESRVKLEVYSILGEKIAVLKNGVLQAGYHSLDFNASKFAAGVYFYRIEASATDGSREMTDTRKMLLIK